MAGGDGARVRARAARAVCEVAYRGTSLDAALAGGDEGLPAPDRALLRELSFGALRWFWRSKGMVDALVKRPLSRRDRVIEALMQVGVYQLEHLRLPPHAAIHSAVEACALLERPGLKGLVNGVLRNVQRRQGGLAESLEAHARDAHPEWLWRAIGEQWPAQARAIIDAGNARPPMTLRVNTRRVTPAAYLEALRSAGMTARRLEHLPEALNLAAPVNVDRLPGFDAGWVSVQDASAQLLPRVAAAAPGERVLDACSAPGGKLTHMLEAFPEAACQGLEMDPRRAERVTDNLRRLGLTAPVLTADASQPEAWWDGRPFDLVILDAPCSASGVIRRHPDIKVLRRAGDIDGFAATQARLLDRLWRTLRPGGRLVYATCSILARENQQQIEAFLARTPDARAESFTLPLGVRLDPGWQVLPAPDGGDGFYYARLRKCAPGE